MIKTDGFLKCFETLKKGISVSSTLIFISKSRNYF